MNIYEQLINGEKFTLKFFNFGDACGSRGVLLDRPQFPVAVLSTDPSGETPCEHCGLKHTLYCEGTVGTPITIQFSTAGVIKWEIGLDAVSNELVLAYKPGGDVLRMEQAKGKLVLGPGVGSPSHERAQLTIRTDQDYGVDVGSHEKALPKIGGYRFNASDQQKDGVSLNKDADVARNWMKWGQGNGTHDWRVGMGDNYDLEIRFGGNAAANPGAVVGGWTRDGYLKLPTLVDRGVGTPLVLAPDGRVKLGLPTDHEDRIAKLEALVAALLATR